MHIIVQYLRVLSLPSQCFHNISTCKPGKRETRLTCSESRGGGLAVVFQHRLPLKYDELVGMHGSNMCKLIPVLGLYSVFVHQRSTLPFFAQSDSSTPAPVKLLAEPTNWRNVERYIVMGSPLAASSTLFLSPSFQYSIVVKTSQAVDVMTPYERKSRGEGRHCRWGEFIHKIQLLPALRR